MKIMIKIAALLLISASLSGCIVRGHHGHSSPPPHYDWHQGNDSHNNGGNHGNHHGNGAHNGGHHR
ncbi:hypothetical protein EYY99_13035 [Hafnia alvei]|nr:hypothetical protein EYY99_13035 [Hafnia alvei]